MQWGSSLHGFIYNRSHNGGWSMSLTRVGALSQEDGVCASTHLAGFMYYHYRPVESDRRLDVIGQLFHLVCPLVVCEYTSWRVDGRHFNYVARLSTVHTT